MTIYKFKINKIKISFKCYIVIILLYKKINYLLIINKPEFTPHNKLSFLENYLIITTKYITLKRF